MKGSSFSMTLLREEYANQSNCSAISPVALADTVYSILDPRRPFFRSPVVLGKNAPPPPRWTRIDPARHRDHPDQAPSAY